jgi:hypothetical protein
MWLRPAAAPTTCIIDNFLGVCPLVGLLKFISVAKGPKKVLWGRKNLGPNFCLICQKWAEKGPNFFEVLI